MCLYPPSVRAHSTAPATSSVVDFQVPRPIAGMVLPLLRVKSREVIVCVFVWLFDGENRPESVSLYIFTEIYVYSGFVRVTS